MEGEKLLVWVSSTSKYLHQSAYSLFMISPKGKKALSYVDNLFEPEFLLAENGVFFTHATRSRKLLSYLDAQTGEVSGILGDSLSSFTLLDVYLDKCLAFLSNQKEGFVVVASKTAIESKTSVTSNRMKENFVQEVVEQENISYVLYKYLGEEKDDCLILFLHGGPHINYDSAYSRIIDHFLENKFSVLLPNYEGSMAKSNEVNDGKKRMNV